MITTPPGKKIEWTFKGELKGGGMEMLTHMQIASHQPSLTLLEKLQTGTLFIFIVICVFSGITLWLAFKKQRQDLFVLRYAFFEKARLIWLEPLVFDHPKGGDPIEWYEHRFCFSRLVDLRSMHHKAGVLFGRKFQEELFHNIPESDVVWQEHCKSKKETLSRDEFNKLFEKHLKVY